MSLRTIRAIRIEAPGGPEVLTLAETQPSTEGPAKGMARIRVETAGVNFIDTYHRTGLYPVPLPFTPGVEAAGRIEALGDESTGDSEGTKNGLAVGDRVAWTGMPGCYADVADAPAARLVAIPDELSTELACASFLQGMTAHYLAHGVRDSKPGDTALVHAAAGGTGGLLVQMLTAAGVRVIATCGTDAKAELAKSAGAEQVILYTREDFQARTRELTDGRGVDVVYDSVGQSTFEGSLGSIRPRGLLCLFGQASGPVPPFAIDRLNGLGSLFVTRPSLGHYIADRAALDLRADAVFGGLINGTLQQRIGGRYALEDAAQAHQDLEGRGTTGKLILNVSSA